MRVGIGAAYSGDLSTVPLYELSGYEKSDAGADGSACGVKSFEDARQLLGRNAGASVFNGECDPRA